MELRPYQRSWRIYRGNDLQVYSPKKDLFLVKLNSVSLREISVASSMQLVIHLVDHTQLSIHPFIAHNITKNIFYQQSHIHIDY